MPRLVETKSGKTVKLYSVGELAKRIDYSTVRTRSMIHDKILPSATFTDRFGRRWFSDRYIRAVEEAKVLRKGRSVASFRIHLTSVFDRMGLVVRGKNIELKG